MNTQMNTQINNQINNKIHLKNEKYIIWSLLIIVNVVLSITSILYYNYWYIFIILLGSASFINSMNVILIFLNLFKKKNKLEIKENDTNTITNTEQKNKTTIINISNENINNKNISNKLNLPSHFLYVLPCYNETEIELNNTIKSILDGLQTNHNIKNNANVFNKITKLKLSKM